MKEWLNKCWVGYNTRIWLFTVQVDPEPFESY